MALSKGYGKGVACLEGMWSFDIQNVVSVSPILDILGKTHGIGSVLLRSSTYEELKYNLEIYKHIRGAGILYWAFHGSKGAIRLGDTTVKLDAIAKLMKKKFRGWVCIFGCCHTLRVDKHMVLDFMSKTEVLMVVGYTGQVNFLVSSCLELLLIDWIQWFRDMKKGMKSFVRKYKNLVEFTGMVVYHR